MKPRPTSDFSIWVQAAADDEDGSPPELFAGAYLARLNQMLTVSFVPEFPRTAAGWPDIDVPDGYEGPTTTPEARAWVALQARYAITPSGTQTEPQTVEDDGERKTWFFVTPDDYAAIAGELEQLAETVHRSGTRVSALPTYRLTKLLQEEVIPHLDADDRHWLTD